MRRGRHFHRSDSEHARPLIPHYSHSTSAAQKYTLMSGCADHDRDPQSPRTCTPTMNTSQKTNRDRRRGFANDVLLEGVVREQEQSVFFRDLQMATKKGKHSLVLKYNVLGKEFVDDLLDVLEILITRRISLKLSYKRRSTSRITS